MAFSTAEVLTLQIALTIVAWGLWGIFDKLALARAEPKDVFLVTAILAIPQIPLVLFLLTWNYGQWHLSSSLIIYASASSVISSLGMALYLDSMKRADSSVVLGMTAAYPLVTQVLGLLIMGEAFSTTRAIGAVFIALGIVVIGLTDNLSPMLWQPSTALPPDEKDAAKERTMGNKHIVPYGLYVAKGYVSPAFAERTGFTDADLSLLFEALLNMFEHDRSAARGEMVVRALFDFEHVGTQHPNNAAQNQREARLGCAHAHKLFEGIQVQLKPGRTFAESFADYDLTCVWTDETLPAGVKLHRRHID